MILTCKIIQKIVVLLSLKNLKQVFPSICSHVFKILLLEYKYSTKSLIEATEIIKVSYQKLFADNVKIIQKVFKKKNLNIENFLSGEIFSQEQKKDPSFDKSDISHDSSDDKVFIEI